MTAERWRAVLAVVEPALELAPGERAAFVRRACGADDALRAEVESLLAADADAGGFLEAPADFPDLAAGAPGAAARGDDLGARLQDTLGTAYRVGRELGGGGMSRVFVAEDTALGRRVVVKVLPPALAAALDVERFRREVRLAAALRHPHIVPLLAAGESPDGLVYYTMPFIEGESLQQRLERDGPLPPAEVVAVVREVADALGYAHARGVVHRDVKPANVLVDGGHAVVADFGIAKALSAAADDGAPRAVGPAAPPAGTLTAAGLVVGTPAYMSPEQARGDAVDARSDVYSLGCMAFELLTGRRPAGHPSALAPAVGGVLARAMAAAAGDRYPTVGELARALAAATAADDLPPPAPAAPPARAGAWTRRRRAAAAGVAAVALAGGAAAVLARAGRPPDGASDGASDGARGRPAAVQPALAVLPFDNLGQPGDAYFADGTADEIATRLARMSGLRVIARASVAPYKLAGAPPRQIGRELGVTHVLQGTVQWAGAPGGRRRVRVTPRLVRAADGTQVWAEPYEAELADVFALQAAVAERVAAALNVTLLAPERRAVAARPTRSVAAYDSYLRGNALATQSLKFVPEARREAVQWYERAVALDPSFAAAWARLSIAERRREAAGDDDPGRGRRARAVAAARRAFALDSTLPEAALAAGALSDGRWGAIERYVVALRDHPNSAELLFALGAEQLHLGRFDDALASFGRAAALDPRAPEGPAAVADLHDVRGEYAAAVRARTRQFALAPDNVVAYVAQALSFLNWRGDTAAARRTLARGVAAVGRPRLVGALAGRSGLQVSRVLWPVLDADSRRALDTLSAAAARGPAWRVYRLKAEHFERSARPARARAYFDSARVALEAALRDRPDDADLHGALGVAYAGLGRRADAMRAGRRGLALAAGGEDADRRERLAFTLAEIAARVGDRDEALARLAAGLPSSAPRVSPYWLRLDPVWAPLRGDPRFERLATPAGPR
jgi:serine/threonine-protein kinase